MTLTLDLSPIIEQQLQDSAAHNGVTVDVQAQSLIAFALQLKTKELRRNALEAQAATAFAASGETEEEMEAYVLQSVKQIRAEMRA